MRIVLGSVICLFLSCARAANIKAQDNLLTTHSRHNSDENPTGRSLLRFEDGSAADEHILQTESIGRIKFKDDSVDSSLENANKTSNFNSEKVSFNRDYNDKLLATDDVYNAPDIDLIHMPQTNSFLNFSLSHKEIPKNDYNDIVQENDKVKISVDNYRILVDESDIKNTENQVVMAKAFRDTNSESISSKYVVFDDYNDDTSQKLLKKTKKYRRIPRVRFESNPEALKNPNFPYYSSELSRPGLDLKDRKHIYHGYPGASHANFAAHSGYNDLVSQTGAKYPAQNYYGFLFGRPGFYSGQESNGNNYSEDSGLTGNTGNGYEYAAGYQGHYGLQGTLAQRAISAVSEALTSIALYDDKQCVPRLLCEVSSGRTSSSPTLLKATAALGPLLTLLQTYNSLSSSPLFIFGRAAVLGVASKGHPAACRYAYPQCPTDPDKLINYLNNHNGGFFRFFGRPDKPKQQQNLEQFYNQLSGQYAYVQQQLKQQDQQQLNYGFPGIQRSYHLYHEHNSQSVNKIENGSTSADIEGRIQNKPVINSLEDEVDYQDSKWIFPDEVKSETNEENLKTGRKGKVVRYTATKQREGSTLKFPDETTLEDIYNTDKKIQIIRKQKGILFPEENYYNIETKYQLTTPVNLDEYIFDYKHKFYVKRPKYTANFINNDNTQTLYIVRGNGDPNHPEIVKTKLGQGY